MRRLIILLCVLLAVILAMVLLSQSHTEPAQIEQQSPGEVLYVSWNTMEFDKCVSVWLITRFIDPNARFEFVPQGTDVTEGVAFDIPGADWSRKHRKCTSMCIAESIGLEDQVAKQIVEMAGKVELNFWQLENWPDAYECFNQVKEIMDDNPKWDDCFEKTNLYFDELYKVISCSRQ
jgi:hypothetical protein